jgi:hypothetical protein
MRKFGCLEEDQTWRWASNVRRGNGRKDRSAFSGASFGSSAERVREAVF